MAETYHSRPTITTSSGIALALHVALIYGVSFSMEPAALPAQTLEITLATFETDKEPDKADYLAQSNQQGSGSLDEKAMTSSDMPAPYQDNTIKPVELQQQAAALPRVEAEKVTKITTITALEKVVTEEFNETEVPVDDRQNPDRQSDLSVEIASLEAMFFQKRQAYTKKPVVHRINTASTRKADVYYQEAWRRKVIRIGQLNYPVEARRDKIYGELRLAVQINRDGSLKNVEVIRSSGEKVLDEAALRIVRMAAPYSSFPPELEKYDAIEIIRTWRFEPGDLFSG